ncbi:MAG: cytochrome c family protein [Rhodobacteraceae bacterium]|nr:cytochrome c family protein [Paracoccaceae bacterium]
MRTVLILAAVTFGLSSLAASADGDPAQGEKVFRKCKACHDIGEGAKNKVGPELNGVVGAPIAGRDDGFAYSDALKAKGADGAVWTDENLAAWLHNPKEFAKGTKMTFAGLKKDDEIADVIAYLQQNP